ncbi:hypothetical protein [Aliivibrio sifiae]|uniref:hypothetical protein n=1 Tax=Aliivibrio sifiae TaxID=566293 RepID=UPI00076A7AA6
MKKEQIISFVLAAAISITTGMVSGTVTVTTLKNDVNWIKTRLSDHEMRIRDLEQRSLVGGNKLS